MSLRWPVAATVVSLLSACARRHGAGAFSSRQVAGIDSVFAQYTKAGSPGCAVGVYQNGAIAFSKGYGMADLERDVPITPATLFDLGSTSKQFAAASVILLANEGKLALTDDVRKYVPEVPDYGSPITIDNLLRHTSGLRDYNGLLFFAGHRIEDATDDADAIDIISRQKALNFSPGTRWDYSNTGFFLLSIIVQRVTGKNLREFAKERIFTPLEMEKTHFRNDHNEILPGRALAYSPKEKDGFRIDLSNWDQLGDGAAQSSVVELIKWDQNFYDPKVGGNALLDQLQEPGTLSDGKPHSYGRGLFLDTYRGAKRVHHGGAWAGYRAMLMRFPDRKTSVAVLCNIGTARTSALAEGVADVVLADVLEPRKTQPAGDLKASAAPAADSARVGGMYYSESQHQIIRIVAQGDSLMAKLGSNDVPLRKKGPSQYSVGGFLELTFPDGTGPAASFTVKRLADELGAYVRVEPARPDVAALGAYTGSYYSPELDTIWKIVVKDGKLVGSARALGETALEPAMPDVFQGSGLLRFRRIGGRVSGFDVDAGRMFGIRFERRGA